MLLAVARVAGMSVGLGATRGMKIAFFGLPLAAIVLGNDGHEIVWAGISRANAIGTRRLQRRIGQPRVHVMPEVCGYKALKELENARPDLLVSWFWTRKIPAAVLRLAPSFGVHPSLLPRHRGADPYFWTIDAGDEVTGVTAHVLEEEYDTGAILAHCQVRLDPTWDAWRLARALDRPSLALLRDVAGQFAAGRPPKAHPQNGRIATVAPEPTCEELAISWSWSSPRIERRVRAAAPWPGAWTELGDRVVTLLRVRSTREFPRALIPAEAAVRADGVAVVRTPDGAIELLEGRDGDLPLSSRDLAALVEAAHSFYCAGTRATIR